MEQNAIENELGQIEDTTIAITYPRFLELRLYLISTLLLAGSIAVPFALHFFGIAGQIFMPIYVFALFAGLVYGWHCGFLVGILAPLASISFTHMPEAHILPFILVKAATIGIISGFLAEQTKGKRLFLITLIAVGFALINGNLLLYMATDRWSTAGVDLFAGFPGILLLLCAVPYFSKRILNYERKIIHRYSRQIKGL